MRWTQFLIASRVKLKIGSVTLVGVALRTAVLDSQTLKQLKLHYVPKYQRLALLECVLKGATLGHGRCTSVC